MAVYIASWKRGGVLIMHCHLYIDGVCPDILCSLTAGHLEGEREKKKQMLREMCCGEKWRKRGPDWLLVPRLEKENNLYYLYITCASLEKRRAMVKTCCMLLYIAINIIHTLYKYINMLCATLPPPFPVKLATKMG